MRRRQAEVVFTEADTPIDAPGRWYARLRPTQVIDTSQRNRRRTIARVVACVVEVEDWPRRGRRRAAAWVQGGGKGSRRHSEFYGDDCVSQAQDWILAWARRRFRIDEGEEIT